MFDVGAMSTWVDVGSEKRCRATASCVADDVKPCASKKDVWKRGRYDAWCECRCMSTKGRRMEVQDVGGMSQDRGRVGRWSWLWLSWSRNSRRVAELKYPRIHMRLRHLYGTGKVHRHIHEPGT